MALDHVKIDPVEGLRQVRAERAKRDFLYFVELITDYEVQWFQRVVVGELQRAGTSDKSTKLGLSLPPGHAKSEYALLYCAWMIARDRDITIKYVTYNTKFARDQFKRLKEILKSGRFVEFFGHAFNHKAVPKEIKLDEENTAEAIGLIGGSGWVHACGFNGGITGSRCDIIVIDDPFKNYEEACSPTIREKRWKEYLASISTRARPNRPLRILMLFTRWHLDDLAGRCKEFEEKFWRWVSFEAIKETPNEREDIEAIDPREDGELLWDAIFELEHLLNLREIDPAIFRAMFQQKPIPDGGALWKTGWFDERWEFLPNSDGQYIQSWDFRGGGKGRDGKGAGTSWVVGMLLFKPDDEARLYLVDLIRTRWGPDDTLVEFKAIQDGESTYTEKENDQRWVKSTTRYVELKADGISVHAHYARKYSGIIGLEPNKDKEQRARDTAPFARAGQLVLPAKARWLGTYEGEIFSFPGAVADDQMDATTQVLNEEFGVDAQAVEFTVTPRIY